MNKTYDEAVSLVNGVKSALSEYNFRDEVKVVFSPPYLFLKEVQALCDDKVYLSSAQNCHQQPSGAYTGEVSAEMIASVGSEYVIVGHSERREYFNESNELLKEKVDIALQNGLKVIFCVGEKLDERKSNVHFSVIEKQIKDSLFHLSAEQFASIVVAYEPVWAIGTGETATSDQAQEVHAFIRSLLSDKFGADVAETTSILYGGSCKPSNAAELFACKDVDGGLIGGASLVVEDFVSIIKAI